ITSLLSPETPTTCIWASIRKVVKKEQLGETWAENDSNTMLGTTEEDGISLIVTFIGKPVMLDSFTSFMCNESWDRSSFARCLIEVNSEADLVDVVTIGIPSLSMDGFTKETIHVDLLVRWFKQNVRYEPKATTSAPKKGVTNVGNTSQSSFMLKTTGNSSKKNNLSMSNSFSALNDEEENDEEDVENVYDESANLIQNTKAGGSSSFMAAAG
nr:ATPase, F1/V1/A1 complex, alpha/beta subunit, zinc knuckle CX2CX4HX4C [Tanacetum cinerariifolium]